MDCMIVLPVSDLHEEGKNAINAPLLPTGADIHPEDTLLGIYTHLHTDGLMQESQLRLKFPKTTNKKHIYFPNYDILNITWCFTPIHLALI